MCFLCFGRYAKITYQELAQSLHLTDSHKSGFLKFVLNKVQLVNKAHSSHLQ